MVEGFTAVSGSFSDMGDCGEAKVVSSGLPEIVPFVRSI